MLSTAKSSFTVPMICSSRLQHDVVVGGVRDRAAGGDRRSVAAPLRRRSLWLTASRCSSAPAAAAAGGEAFGQHLHDLVELLARERPVGPRAPRAARTARPRPIRRHATSAAICCASTSSGFTGMRSRSSSPRRTASSSAAHSTRSSRDSGNRRPFGSAADRVAGAARRAAAARRSSAAWTIWHTRSTWPMSMPSSSEDVATSALSSPRFRLLLGIEPLLARQTAVMRR